ncbi:MAG: CehA/McbA family metallohydrolase [Betaproteobacteria bacterium]|nr:CehA/McbA family metallohydrolase [Betaproteobacteria bacterium]
MLAVIAAYLLSPLAIAEIIKAVNPDHHEFEATLHAPYRGSDATEARNFTLQFEYPGVQSPHTVNWQLELQSPSGQLVQRWQGSEALFRHTITVNVPWSGPVGPLADGIYQVRMIATATDNRRLNPARREALTETAENDDVETIEQSWPIQIGRVAEVDMPAFRALAVGRDGVANRVGNAKQTPITQASAPANNLPYTIYYGNLHSQSNHSDGGVPVASCGGAENPQAGQFGPTDAYQFALNQGLDLLVTSEHNHMYDGSTGTNTAADPVVARNLYQSGLTAANNFNVAHPNFLGVYGMEWGVINNGGHLNIFNSNELLSWELNSAGQVIGDTFTTKGDYAALYTLMRQRGWVGQFNHPATSGQFAVNGVALGYTADGDQAMVLCEVLNSSAFSINTTETETGRSTYEGACNKLLEAGYHVAFSTNQDNHCANWGASYTNRTGILIPNGTALSKTAFVDALKARRVFASMDKNSQLILTANGHIMGERFTNSGPLTLTANYANSAGRSVSTVAIFEGVPGRNGTVTQLSSTAVTTITPALGEHFYYAKLTQDDGKILWSAPIWVTQGAATDTTAPTVSASETGSSGTITLNATASDNVGVTRVDFLVDNIVKGSSSTAPYSLALNSTTLSNGSHSLTAKAYDAAGNVGTSSAVNFSVNNVVSTQLIVNGGFESGGTNWTATTGVITSDPAQAAHGGTWKAWLNGYGAAHTDTLYQQLTIPSTATTATLSFWLRVDSSETTTTSAFDTLKVQLRNSSGTVLTTLATYSNLNKGTTFIQRSFNVSTYKGQTVRVYFEGVEGSQIQTSFIIDDVSLIVQ